MPQVARLWPVWIAVTLALTAKPFLWHLDYFRRPGPQFLPAYLAGLALLGVATFVYLRWRRPAREPQAFALFFLAFFLFYSPAATLYSLGVLFACFTLGRRLLGKVADGALDQVTLFPAAGLGALSAVMFVLGIAHLYYRWVVLAMLAAVGVAGWQNVGRIRDLWRRIEKRYAEAASGPLCGLCVVFVFVFALASAMVALSPEIAFDPVSFHFVYAREWANRHFLDEVPRLPYSYFPQNVEILYTLGFLLDGQETAKVLTYAFFPLSAMTLVLIGRRWFSAQGALVGAALYIATPFISWTGSVAKNDLALALNLLLAVYCVLRWTEEKRFGWLAAGVMFVGFGFGVKHVAMLGALPLAVVIAWRLPSAKLRLRQFAILVAIFAASGLYWHARTFALRGHPLYPEFGASAVRSTTAAGHPELSRLERVWIYATTPWMVHFRGLGAFESPSPNPAGFALVAFLPLLFLGGGVRNRPASLLLVYAGAYFLYWALILIKVRYAIVAFGILFVYLGDRIWAFSSGRRIPTLALAAYCFVFALSVTLILEMNGPRLKLFAKQITREEFLRESLITYRSIEAMNRTARPGEFAYSVGNCSTFYSNIEFHCYYDHLGRYSLDQVARDLRETHYTYLVVSNDWAEPRHMAVVEHLYRTELLHHDESFRVYKLRREH